MDVFIVLSGFCLTLPVASGPEQHLKGGVTGHLKRRARRILPPYYAALALSFVPLIAAHVILGGARVESAGWRYNFAALPIVSHLLVIHNLWPSTVTMYDPPMWSVATEWQIYFIFPILLWLGRRSSFWLATAFAIVLGLLPHFLLPHYTLDWASPWFLGLFAMGMLAALISVSASPDMTRIRDRAPWGGICALLFIPGFVLGVGAANETSWAADLLVGAASGALLISCARASRRRRTAPASAADATTASRRGQSHIVLDILSAKAPVRLGIISYSLYLIHSLFIIYYARLLQDHPVHSLASSLGFFAVGTVGSLAMANLFFLVVERWFLPGHLHTVKRETIGTILEPAP